MIFYEISLHFLPLVLLSACASNATQLIVFKRCGLLFGSSILLAALYTEIK